MKKIAAALSALLMVACSQNSTSPSPSSSASLSEVPELLSALSSVNNPSIRDDIAHRIKTAPKPTTKAGRALQAQLIHRMQYIPKAQWAHLQYFDLETTKAYDLELGEIDIETASMTAQGKVMFSDGTLMQHPDQEQHQLRTLSACQPFHAIKSFPKWSGIESEIYLPPAENVSYVAGIDEDQSSPFGAEAAYNYMTIVNSTTAKADAEAGLLTSARTEFRRGRWYLYVSINGTPKYFRDYLPDGGAATVGSDGFLGSRSISINFQVVPSPTVSGDLRLNVIDSKTGFQKIYTTNNTAALNAGSLFDYNQDHAMSRTSSLLVNSPGGYIKYDRFTNTKLLDYAGNGSLWGPALTAIKPYNGDDRASSCTLANKTITSTMINPDYTEETTIRIN